ncbi:MAG: polysaccharide biosynthesis/export family protein [Pseudomonadota bacterium]
MDELTLATGAVDPAAGPRTTTQTPPPTPAQTTTRTVASSRAIPASAETAAPTNTAVSARDASGKQTLSPNVRARARQTVAKITSVSNPTSAAYRVGPLDVLSITVFKVPDLSLSPEVSEAGTINYPLLGEIPVAGKTARDIERVLTKKLNAKYLRNPQVTVAIKEHNSQRVTVEGAVKKPGVFPIRGGMSLLQAIATANGMDEASDNTVVVFRTTNGKRSAARFDLDQIRTGKSDDPPLYAGDVVVAGRSAFKEGVKNVLTALRFTSVFALF